MKKALPLTSEKGDHRDGPWDSSALGNDNRRKDFEAIVRQHHAELVAYINRWVRCGAVARHIAQEVYTRTFPTSGPVVASRLRRALFDTARNLAADWVRRRVAREAFADDGPLSQEDVLTPDEEKALRRAFKLLPPKTRMAFILLRVDKLSYEDAAEKLGVEPNIVRRLIFRGMEFLLEAVTQVGKG